MINFDPDRRPHNTIIRGGSNKDGIGISSFLLSHEQYIEQVF